MTELQKSSFSAERVVVLGFEVVQTALFLVSAAVISLVESTGVFLWTPLLLGLLLQAGFAALNYYLGSIY